MKIMIKEILLQQEKTLQWLSMETQIPYPTLHKIVTNKTESIKFEFIEKICKTLGVKPNDILEIE